MPTLLEFKSGDQTVLVDVTPSGEQIRPAGAEAVVIRKVESTFDQALSVAGAIATSFQRVMDECRLTQAELELGFQFTGKGSLYLVQSEAQAALKITVTFQRDEKS